MVKPLPHIDPFLTPLQQTTFEKRRNVSKQGILHLPQCFHLFTVVIYAYIEVFFFMFALIYLKLSAADFFYEGKGQKEERIKNDIDSMMS